MIELQPVSHVQDFKDRRTGLIVLGILSIVVGGLWALMALFMPLILIVSTALPQAQGQAQVSVRDVVIGCLTYALLAAIFIAAGIGSVRVRRWARPVMLVVGWTWLLAGIVSGAMWAMMAPDFADAMTAASQGAPMPPGFQTMVLVIGGVFFLLFMLLIPGVLVWFYQSRHVRRTLEVFDPVERWTDRCPTQVLGLSLGLAYGAVMCLFMLGYPAIPVFHVLLTGPAAMAVDVLLALAMAWLAWKTYKLSPAGWWGSLTLFILLPASLVVTFLTLDPIEIYRQMGFPREQVEMMKQYKSLTGPTLAVFTGIIGAAFAGFIVYLRRYFYGQPASPTQIMPSSA